MLTKLTLDGLAVAFPFHLICDDTLTLTHVAPRYERLCPSIAVGAKLPDVATLVRPTVDFTVAKLEENLEIDVILAAKEKPALRVHGRVLRSDGGGLVFLATPWVGSLADVAEAGLSLADFPSHDLLIKQFGTIHARDVAMEDARRLANELRLLTRAQHISTETNETTGADTERLAALGRLVASMAHEINTPLGVARIASSLVAENRQSLIDAFASGAMTRGHLQQYLDDTGDALEMLSSNLARVAELVVSFRQVVVDRRHEERRTVRLVPFVEEVLNTLGPQLVAGRVRVTVAGDRQFSDYTYPGAIARLLTALVENALAHAYETESFPTLNIGVRATDSSCYLVCEDNGKGIPESITDRIFEPFFTTRRMAGGTGLGLYVAHNIAHELLGGGIRAEPITPHGSRFVIRWPASKMVQS